MEKRFTVIVLLALLGLFGAIAVNSTAETGPGQRVEVRG